MSTDYDTDFYVWSQEQARLLRARCFGQLDITHLAEEIEDLGKGERRALENRLGVLLGHLLKWQAQPDYPNRKSWRATINTRRRAIAKLLEENPSLRREIPALIVAAYPDGRDLAVAETPFDYEHFAEHCPWTTEDILDDWWPQPAGTGRAS